MSEMLKVTMLGTFSLTLGDNRLDDGSNRMKKVWLLLAYLIYHRNSRLTQGNYIALLPHKLLIAAYLFVHLLKKLCAFLLG